MLGGHVRDGWLCAHSPLKGKSSNNRDAFSSGAQTYPLHQTLRRVNLSNATLPTFQAIFFTNYMRQLEWHSTDKPLLKRERIHMKLSFQIVFSLVSSETEHEVVLVW